MKIDVKTDLDDLETRRQYQKDGKKNNKKRPLEGTTNVANNAKCNVNKLEEINEVIVAQAIYLDRKPATIDNKLDRGSTCSRSENTS